MFTGISILVPSGPTLCCFFFIEHDRREILHCNVTRQSNAFSTMLQLCKLGDTSSGF